MLETKFKTNLIATVQGMLPGCIIMHLDPNEIQGIPDIIILHRDKWATLEGKRDLKTYSKECGKRPNQEYYVNLMNNMSFSRFVYPENKDDVLKDLNCFFGDC